MSVPYDNDESEVIAAEREEARSEAFRYSPTQRERLYGAAAPTKREIDEDER